MEWGLERVQAALDEIGNPQRGYPTIHVAGTNGKGSVAATIAAVLTTGRLRAGLYTSPHLCSFRERFQVSGRPVPEERLIAAADSIKDVVMRERLTFFEAATVLAFHVFARERVDVAVIEVGLGGRLDATNVVRPEVSVITNIAMDHADFLGNTLQHIAAEKAGIAKEGVPLVTGETDPAVLAVLERACAEAGAPFHPLAPSRVRDVRVTRAETSFTADTGGWGPLQLTTPLIGAHQAMNVALAVDALERLPPDLRPPLRAVVTGVDEVYWPGRNQIEEIDGRTWLLDVAHNVAGARSLCELLDRLELPRPWVALLGALADKEWKAMLGPVLHRVDRAVLTQPPSAPHERRWDLRDAEAALRSFAVQDSLAAESDFERAFGRAQSATAMGTVIVTGSSHTVGDVMRLLQRCPFGG